MLGLSLRPGAGHGLAGVEWAGEAESSGTLGVVSWISSRVDTKVPVTGG